MILVVLPVLLQLIPADSGEVPGETNILIADWIEQP
jgi:hypothetical protein